ncbi:MAG TPA: pyruvate dehydrogenase (acetyl-transferring) E1 component subunit alpha [Gammaproteobacteria bacterium]|nr:pyruvate dehydrogenase (acetyl-transferring) E1 component subunit alpha [Gammaproteobacteria bacterium]
MTTVAQFSIEYIQFLNAEGKLTQPLPPFAQDPQVLLDMYRHMVFTRIFDAKAVTLQRTGKMGTFPSSLGQEAIAAGIAQVMHQEDLLVPYYRDQGIMMARGVKPAKIFAYWGGDERGSDFEPAHDFPISVPIATQLLHACGAAYAISLRKQPRAVLTTCGDGGTSEGDFYEAINFAGVFKVPLVFVVNNNQWAISVPRNHQTGAVTIAQKAIAGGFEGIQVDGNDPLAVGDVVGKALDKARKGLGPTLVEAITYRLCDHTTADDAKRYVNKADLDNAWQCEPIARLRRYLESQQLWTENDEEKLQQQCAEEIALAVNEYLNLPPQPATAMLDYLYATLPEAYREQREELSTQAVPVGH